MADTPEDDNAAAQRKLQRQARLMRDVVGLEAWREFESILREQIAARVEKIVTPLHILPAGDDFLVLDWQSRTSAMEALKGAVLGLRLALSTPHDIIQQAKDILSEANEKDEDLPDAT